jgi:predicted unusual protein kinase regulating ubiquinone biosynthesis (AarF/ABC1/UbiB family)
METLYHKRKIRKSFDFIAMQTIYIGMQDSSKPIDDRFGGTVTRYGRVGTTMAGLAAKLAGEKFLGLKIDRDVHANDLMMAIGNLKGPLMKVGQILSTIPEALPPEYAEAFQQLQSNAPPMNWSFVRRRMRAELGADWEQRFRQFDQESSAAASLGQVHKAVTLDGITVACKLQYPDMQSAITADLNQLNMIFSLYQIYDQSIKTDAIFEELKERLNEELDYRLESRHQKLYAHLLRNEKNIHVPKIFDELSTDRLLVSEWVDGQKILNFKSAPIETRNQIALNLFRAWYVPLYFTGIIHGDPHLGNYTVRDDLSINLLDFGCIRKFPPSFVQGVIELYRSLQNDNIEQTIAAFEIWGFKNLTKEQIEILSIWARFLYDPILDDKVRVIGETKHGVYGRETAQKVHAEIKRVGGGINIPREFVFMDRAALGLGSVFIHLQAEINWHELFEDMIKDFDVKNVEAEQKKLFTQFDV